MDGCTIGELANRPGHHLFKQRLCALELLPLHGFHALLVIFHGLDITWVLGRFQDLLDDSLGRSHPRWLYGYTAVLLRLSSRNLNFYWNFLFHQVAPMKAL